MTSIDLMERTHALVSADGMLYAARQTGFYQIGEAGDAQRLHLRGLPDDELPILALACDSSAGLLLAGVQGGVLRSADGGSNWEAVPFRAPPPLVTCLALLPSGEVLAGTYEDGVFRSDDGGGTWRAHNHGIFDHSVNCLVLSPGSDEGIVYAGVSSGLYRSENGGKLWRDIRMPAGDEMVLSLATSLDGAALYAGTESHGLLRSLDGGQTWAQLLRTEGAVNALALVPDSTVIAQVDDAVLRSSDDGATWTEIAAGSVDCILLDEDGGRLILALSDGGLRRVAL